jgi:hypothetical protein
LEDFTKSLNKLLKKSKVMSFRNIAFFLLFIVCFQNTVKSQQTEAEFENYFMNNLNNLTNIEGIYEVNIELSKGTFYYPECYYTNPKFEKIDKIVIIKKGNEFKVFSLKKRIEVGRLSIYERDMKYFRGLPKRQEILSFQFYSNGTPNYLSSKISQPIYNYDGITLYRSAGKIENIYDLFDYNIAK